MYQSGHDQGLFHEGTAGISILRFHHIILGIYEEDIPSYNAPQRALLEEKNIKLDREKEEIQKSNKLSGD